jgi:hypothetical protein
MFQRDPPPPIVPPVVLWDASYAEPMGTPQTATVRRGIIKIVCQFPDEGEQPKRIHAIVEYRGDLQDSAIARMMVFSNISGLYTLELVGAALAPRHIVHIEWQTQYDQTGTYDILIEHGVMRPTPAVPPPGGGGMPTALARP